MSYCHDVVFAAFDNVGFAVTGSKTSSETLAVMKSIPYADHTSTIRNYHVNCAFWFTPICETTRYFLHFCPNKLCEYAKVRTYQYGGRRPTLNHVIFASLVMKHIITCTTNGRMCNFRRHNTNLSCYYHEYVMNTLSVSSRRGTGRHRMYVCTNHRNTHMQAAFVTR